MTVRCYSVCIETMLEGFNMIDYRDRAIELVDDGNLDPMMALTMCLQWMSNDDVAEMLDANELSERFMEEDDDFALEEEF